MVRVRRGEGLNLTISESPFLSPPSAFPVLPSIPCTA